ncbi:MAG: DUF3626 domain-containing protein [Kiritimatiellae bacterium]|nr:DUF3626 domain-containing protein [Kiritimatiellia bacterium]
MALDISFAQFDAIASGDYNAGQIDYEGNGANVSLKKVNAHVYLKILNTKTIDANRTVELKRAFVKAMSTRLAGNAGAIAEIRRSLGLPPDDSNPKALSQRTIEPLTRQEVREIIDRYVKHTGGENAQAVDQDVVDKRDAVNLANQRALPIRIGEQSFRLDKMAEELGKATVAEPTKTQAAQILKTLTRPSGKVDIPTLARALNVFAFMAERAAAAGQAEGAKDAGERFSSVFAQALDSLDNGALSQVYQGLISRDTDAMKDELSRRLAKFDLTAEQSDVCERTVLALGRLESLVLSEISHRVVLGKAKTDVERGEIAAQAPVFRRCGDDVARDLSARSNAGEMTSVNLEILTTRAAYGNINEGRLAGKVSNEMCAAGFTQVDTHAIGDMIRKSELTVNTHLSNLLGWREGQDPKNPPLFQPGYSLVNTFVSKEQKGIAKDSTGYLRRRNDVERRFFPEYAEMAEFKGRDRPVYAAFNMSNAKDGAAPFYGNTVVVLREHVKQQATYTLDDTFFAVKYHFGEDASDRFLEKLSERLGSSLDDGAIAALKDVTTQGGSFLRMLFRENAGRTFNSHSIEMQAQAVVATLNAHLREGAKAIDRNDVNAVFLAAFGVADEEVSRAAGYDNIENLLESAGNTRSVAFGLATVRRLQNPKAPIGLRGCDYIEAQLHGPIVFSRDVEEMRVHKSDIRDHYRALYDADSSVAGGMARDAWVAMKSADDERRLLQFGRDNGFKVTFYDSSDTKLDAPESFEADCDIDEANKILRPRNYAFVNSLANENLAELVGFHFRMLPEGTRTALAAVFGDNLSSMPEGLRAFLRRAVERVRVDVDNLEHGVMGSEDDMRNSAGKYVTEAMKAVADVLDAAAKSGVDDPARIAELVGAAGNSDVAPVRIVSFVMAQIAKERICADPQAVVRDALAKELADRMPEVEAMGRAGGFALGGNAMELLLSKVLGHLAQFAVLDSGFSATSAEEVMDSVRKDVVVPFLRKRLDVLKMAGERPFPDEAFKNAYYGWALSGKRIRSQEEASGVRDCAETFADSFGAVLTGKDGFNAAGFMKAFADFIKKLDESFLFDRASHPQDAYGTDDRNGYIFRGVSIGLAAIEGRHGRDAIVRLSNLMSSKGMTEVFAAMASAVECADLDQSVPLVKFSNFASVLAGRISEKYGIATQSVPRTAVDYSQVPPDARSLVAIVAPDVIAGLDARFPYAPQVVKSMPPVANPAAAPKNLAERKRALMGALPAYGAHEKSFENGRNVHGRGHATRVFIFANVLGNIMRERGVNVDMGSLSISAAGHDMGRKGTGTDYWEKESGALVEQLAETTYPGAYGDEWKTQANLNVSAGHGQAADAQRSVEGLLMKAADSLDYTRVAPLKGDSFHFLEKTVNVGGVHVMRDDNLRNALMHEAELLTKATSPLAEKREEIKRLKGSEDETESLRGKALEAEVTKSETELAQLTDEQVVERIEAEIRDNPAKYPLLTKYYLNAE